MDDSSKKFGRKRKESKPITRWERFFRLEGQNVLVGGGGGLTGKHTVTQET